MKKRERPKVIEDDLEPIDFIKVCEEEDYIYGALIQDIEVNELEKTRLHLDHCIFKNVTFSNCEFDHCDLIDVIFDHCDLSNISMYEGGIHRTHFNHCRMSGSDFSSSVLQNVHFDKVLGKYMNFSFGTLKYTDIDHSDLEFASFNGCTFKDLKFDESNLNRNEFINTILDKVDVSTCTIEELTITADSIKGLKVSSAQALDLSRVLGLIIVD